ncbi:hypothetical protein [Aequorivita soesokkakensis]|uniref:hypothetical protein n=1 Tax=Aequorivita soesokkakensis TaxID=1385699 RepID=UPI0010426E28|nr:hypothetical protein [Aequorivita soesokkakensis]
MRSIIAEKAIRIIEVACQKNDFVSLRKVTVTSLYVYKSIANNINTAQEARLKIQPNRLDSSKRIPEIINSKPSKILN